MEQLAHHRLYDTKDHIATHITRKILPPVRKKYRDWQFCIKALHLFGAATRTPPLSVRVTPAPAPPSLVPHSLSHPHPHPYSLPPSSIPLAPPPSSPHRRPREGLRHVVVRPPPFLTSPPSPQPTSPRLTPLPSFLARLVPLHQTGKKL